MLLFSLAPFFLATAVTVLAAPVPVFLGDGPASNNLVRRTNDKIYRGGTAPIMPKDEHNEIKKDKDGNYVHGGTGISVTTNPGTLPHPKVREMDKNAAASKFQLTHTPTANDQGHHSLDIKPGQKFTPEQLKTHLSSGWTPVSAHERLNQIPAHKQDLKQQVQKLANKEPPPSTNHGQHPAASTSHAGTQPVTPHSPPASQHQRPAASAPNAPGARSWAQVAAGKSSTPAQHPPASHPPANNAAQTNSRAASPAGHTAPHPAPPASNHGGTPPASPHPAPHVAPAAAPAAGATRSWAQVAASPARKVSPATGKRG